jgi:hypothetical protein
MPWSADLVLKTIMIDDNEANEAAIKSYNTEHGTNIVIRQLWGGPQKAVYAASLSRKNLRTSHPLFTTH